VGHTHNYVRYIFWKKDIYIYKRCLSNYVLLGCFNISQIFTSNNVSFQLFLPSSTNHFIYISVAECCLRIQIKGDNSFNNILVFICNIYILFYDLTEGYCEYKRTDTNINTEDYQTAWFQTNYDVTDKTTITSVTRFIKRWKCSMMKKEEPIIY
jgi:hypothetical protein